MMKLKQGSLFANHYEVVRVVSAGGMGVVYEVLHKETKRKRALKVMLPHVLEDKDMRDRFALEAVVTADIESEHLVEIFDAGIDAETECPFIVMELLRGEDLGKRLERGERYSPAEVLTLIEQCVRALEKTHEQGIVHRDLKPENLFITKRDDGSPRLKVLDFGIAKLIKTTNAGKKNTTRSFGTPFYIPREQLTGEVRLIGPASDLYSLAHIVYTMLVGAPYFDDEATTAANVLSLLAAVGNGTTEPASARASRHDMPLPPGFDAWFAKATHLDPSQRFTTAPEFLETLRGLFTGVTPATTIGRPRFTSSMASTIEADGEVQAASAPTLVDRVSRSRTPSGRDGPTRDFVPGSSSDPDAGADPRKKVAGSSQAFAKPASSARATKSRLPVVLGIGLFAALGAGALLAKQMMSASEPSAIPTTTQSDVSATHDATAGPIEAQISVTSMAGTLATTPTALLSIATSNASASASASASKIQSSRVTIRAPASASAAKSAAPPAATTTPATSSTQRPERIR